MQIPHDNGVSTFRVVLSVIAYLTSIPLCGCDRYYPETNQNNKFITIPVAVSASVFELFKYTFTGVNKEGQLSKKTTHRQPDRCDRDGGKGANHFDAPGFQ